MFQVSTRHACHYTNIWWYKEKLVQKKKKKQPTWQNRPRAASSNNNNRDDFRPITDWPTALKYTDRRRWYTKGLGYTHLTGLGPWYLANVSSWSEKGLAQTISWAGVDSPTRPCWQTFPRTQCQRNAQLCDTCNNAGASTNLLTKQAHRSARFITLRDGNGTKRVK